MIQISHEKDELSDLCTDGWYLKEYTQYPMKDNEFSQKLNSLVFCIMGVKSYYD